MGMTKNVDMSANNDTIKIVGEAADDTQTTTKSAAKAKKAHQRSRTYRAVRGKIDKNHPYDAFAAVEMIKKLSYSKFDGTVETHLQLRSAGESVNITFPHSTGKKIRVAIATDDLLTAIEGGQIDFDVLIAQPKYMPKLAKLAKILGPKGLMPNPKNGTLTEDPAAKQAELEKGTLTIKTEKKFPLMHVAIGKVSMETKDLVENLQALLKAVKGKAIRAHISATMSPSVRVEIE